MDDFGRAILRVTSDPEAMRRVEDRVGKFRDQILSTEPQGPPSWLVRSANREVFPKIKLAGREEIASSLAVETLDAFNFQSKIGEMVQSIQERERAELLNLVQTAIWHEVTCGILIVRGSKMVDGGDLGCRMTMKTVMGFHPSVPVDEIRCITDGVIDWDVLESQLEQGGEHDGRVHEEVPAEGVAEGGVGGSADDRPDDGIPRASGPVGS